MKKRARKASLKRRLTVADVFAGAGGLSAGFSMAKGPHAERCDVVFAVDHDKQAIATYRANHFPDVPREQANKRVCCDDVKNLNAQRIRAAIWPHRRVDVLIGGPSCQGVSPAGLRNPDDERNQMLLAFVRLVRELRPQWFVMENVPGLTHANNRELLAEILKLLGEIKGYEVAADVLLAADFGVPQLRYRLFVIGTRTGARIRFPAPTHSAAGAPDRKNNSERTKPYATVSDAIRDLSQIEPVEIDPGVEPETPKDGIPNHWCRGITKVNRRRIATVRNGRDWRDIPVKLLPERYFTTRSSDQKGSYGRLAWDWPAYTVTNASLNITAGAFTHPVHDRCLSVREVARLQSFDDSYVFQGSVEAQYRQVGNAVPPLLAKAVAETILHVHFGRRHALRLGQSGRLTRDLIERSVAEGFDLPALTPRWPHPDVARSTRSAAKHDAPPPNRRKSRSVWNRSPRPIDPWAEQTKRLRVLANQPRNVRAAKRAQSIVNFIDGMPRSRILKLANASEASVRKWVDRYYAHGLDGWRAYHTSLNHLSTKNPRLQKSIQTKVAKARKLIVTPKKVNGVAPKRLHMNGYVRHLIRRFGKYSTEALIKKVERRLDVRLGTVYVGDLLGIADAVLRRRTHSSKANHTSRVARVARRMHQTARAILRARYRRSTESRARRVHRAIQHIPR